MKVELKKQKVFKDFFSPTKQTIQENFPFSNREHSRDMVCEFTTVHNTHL